MLDTELRTSYSKLQSELGFWLGYGRGAEFSEVAWDAYTTRTLVSLIEGALRRVYTAHKWLFLKPNTEFTLASGANTIPMPLDWAGHESEAILQLDSSGAAPYCTIPWVGPQRVRVMLGEFPSVTGPPEMIAEEMLRGVKVDLPQQGQLIVYPVADQAYTLNIEYYMMPPAALAKLPYVYGGPQYSQLFIDACLCEGQNLLFGRLGDRQAIYNESLAVAVELDMRQKPRNLGLNTTREREPGTQRRRGLAGTTWAGVSPGDGT